MHLKSLTLKGFKSFASSTTLRFEPGITCVVGPNGSGKSNVVDALSWVMGEQGAKSLRGAKMEDVIFAGTTGRAPLGRAEVSLTIDNTDGALPIDYTEVTITRTMFRNGGSEYAINGNSARLLDVQELLYDSGIGREMHVIVGQGRLDSVLSATPEDRRGFIEEAAGVLKHRKRKEKALRKLDAMQANLTRLQDLTSELRRQLKPLGRQAEIARRASVIQADLRDARLRLLADDLVQLRSALEQEKADESALRARRSVVEAALAKAAQREAELEQAAQADAPLVARAQETWYQLSSLRERLRGTAVLAAERTRNLAGEIEERPSAPARDPEALEAEAARIREQEAEFETKVAADREVLARVVQDRQSSEAALAAAEKQLAIAIRSAADRREGLARLAGQVSARRTKVEAGEAELGRLTAALEAAAARAAEAHREYAAVESQVAGLDRGEEDLDAEHEAASSALAAAESNLNELREQERVAERDRSAFAARKEALELGLAPKDGAGALLAGEGVEGVLGSVAALIDVAPGFEKAIAGALGAAADAVAVASLDTALDALGFLKSTDAGRAGMVVGHPGDAPATEQSAPPHGARWALDLVTAPEALRPALARLLGQVLVVDDLAAARPVLEAAPERIVATRAGDVLGADFALGGSASVPSLLEVQAAVDEAAQRLAEANHHVERLRFQLSAATEEHQRAAARVGAALTDLHQSDANLAAIAERLAQFGSAARAANGEAERLREAISSADDALRADRSSLDELAERLALAEAAPDDGEPGTDERDRRAAACTAARQVELEARLAVRTGEERARALSGRAESLDRAARQEREARARERARRERNARAAAVASAVSYGAGIALNRLEGSLERATAERREAEQARTVREGELQMLRGRIRELGSDLEGLVDSVHRDEVARAEQRLRIETLEARALEELGVDAESLVEEYGPHLMVPPSPPIEGEQAPDPVPEPVPYVREQQQRRLRSAERALTTLGKVNPLALEEYDALQERAAFLTRQLEDLKDTRRDLLDIVREVDERVEQVFTSAYQDTAREFEQVFARLFPGGEGRLVLTNPQDMLTTGIEVEARPPGKKIKRLSLLSGGERSLTAVALLVAIFKARPSPFYVLDEVEAALDDTNLGRLLMLLEELRESSQLIVVTHQKRTMEVADALYGVSMRGDGVTSVISQRLREAESA